MTSRLAVSGSELEEVKAILDDLLPSDVQVSVFGSRARGTPKPWSDLDLALHGPQPLTIELLGALREAFDESGLPWKVDIVDRCSVSPEFGGIIDETMLPLPRGPSIGRHNL